MTRRFVIAGGLLTAAMIGLGLRLAFLHFGEHEIERNRIARAWHVGRRTLAPRGDIYDRAGPESPPVAMNVAVRHVCADPHLISGKGESYTTAVRLARSLGVPAAWLAAVFDDKDRRFAYVKRFVDMDKTREIEAENMAGIFFRDDTARRYPNGVFMCHVLGFVNHEGEGSGGIEQCMDRYLKGSPGMVESKVDGRRRELYWRRKLSIPALRGSDVFLTLDQHVQYFAERALDEVVRQYDARGAWAIVQAVKTGEILAMACRPGFDLNEFRFTSPEQRLNRAIGYVYEPGSTLKVLTIAAALNEGLVRPDTVIECENGAWQYGGRVLGEYRRGGYGALTVADILKKSSNIGTAKTAVMLGDERLHGYFRDFGLGQAVGVDLPGEETGILHPPSRWSTISASRMAIGQGVAVTSLQMLNAVCAIANDGALMKPYTIRRVTGEDGTVLVENGPESVSRPVRPGTARVMRQLMTRVVEHGGTGTKAGIEGYSVAGKTGTAQKPVPGGYSDSAHMASFVGFAPAGNPQIAAIVVVDEPQQAHTGGTVAAPVFRSIMEQTLRYMNIPPDEDRLASLD